MGDFSIFWCLFTKPADTEHVSRAEIMVVGSGNSIGTCDSKTARKSALFLCPLLARVGDELAVMGYVVR